MLDAKNEILNKYVYLHFMCHPTATTILSPIYIYVYTHPIYPISLYSQRPSIHCIRLPSIQKPKNQQRQQEMNLWQIYKETTHSLVYIQYK